MKIAGLKLRKLRAKVVHPGDVVILQGPEAMSFGQAQGIDAAFHSVGVECLVIGGGLKVVGIKPARNVFGLLDDETRAAEAMDAEGYGLAHS